MGVCVAGAPDGCVMVILAVVFRVALGGVVYLAWSLTPVLGVLSVLPVFLLAVWLRRNLPIYQRYGQRR